MNLHRKKLNIIGFSIFFNEQYFKKGVFAIKIPKQVKIKEFKKKDFEVLKSSLKTKPTDWLVFREVDANSQ